MSLSKTVIGMICIVLIKEELKTNTIPHMLQTQAELFQLWKWMSTHDDISFMLYN